VKCPTHGPTVIGVPWARYAAGHNRAFDDTVAWLAVHTSKTAIVELPRIAWVAVGAIVARVVDEARAAVDPFDGLRRIGIDEISYKRGHRYLLITWNQAAGLNGPSAPHELRGWLVLGGGTGGEVGEGQRKLLRERERERERERDL